MRCSCYYPAQDYKLASVFLLHSLQQLMSEEVQLFLNKMVAYLFSVVDVRFFLAFVTVLYLVLSVL